MIAVLHVLITTFAAITPAQALPGAASAVDSMKDPNTTVGLCTPDNKGQSYYDEGYCKSLYEMIKKKPCVREKITEMRCWALGEDDAKKDAGCRELEKNKADEQRGLSRDQKEAAKKKEDEKPKDVNLECDSKDKKKGISDLAKDQDQWDMFMLQYFSLVILQESRWDVQNGLKGTRFQDGEAGGLMNISITQMDDKANSCGCQVTDSSGQGDASFQGPSPGVIDGHHNAMCGSFMGLQQAVNDGELFSGGKSKDDPPKGFAVLFKSMQDPGGNSNSDPFAFMKKKLKNYCENYAFSKTGPWPGPLSEDGGLSEDMQGTPTSI